MNPINVDCSRKEILKQVFGQGVDLAVQQLTVQQDCDPKIAALQGNFFQELKETFEGGIEGGSSEKQQTTALRQIVREYMQVIADSKGGPLNPFQQQQRNKLSYQQDLQITLAIRASQKTLIHFNETVEQTNLVLLISDKYKKAPQEITENDLKEYKKKRLSKAKQKSRRICNQLIKEEDAKSEKLGKAAKANLENEEPQQNLQHKNITQSKKSQTRQVPVRQEPVRQALNRQALAPLVKAPSKAELRLTHGLSINKRQAIFTLASRVSRWETKNFEEIRAFWDKQGTVQQYRDLSDEEILKQRAYHLLTGLELVLSEEQDRKIYSFPTAQGLGVLCKMRTGEEGIPGVIYLGINENVIYHKHFITKLFDKIGEIFQDQEPEVQDQEPEVNPLQAAAEAPMNEWKSTTKNEFAVSDRGVLTINYPNDNYSIEIYPVRRDLLDPRLFDK